MPPPLTPGEIAWDGPDRKVNDRGVQVTNPQCPDRHLDEHSVDWTWLPAVTDR